MTTLRLIKSIDRSPSRLPLLLIPLVLACFALSPIAQAVVPPPDGGYPAFTTAEGTQALQSLTTGAGNTGIGWRSLFVDTTGNFNTGIGAGALVLNNADSNTAVGAVAMLLNATGTRNTAVGTDALVFNGQLGHPGANFNDAFGAFALMNNLDGFSNNAMGDSALFTNVHGAENTAVGDLALANNNNDLNTAVGGEALFNNTDGADNNAVGFQALDSNTVGSFNQAMGVLAAGSNDDGAANIAVGDTAMGSNVHGSFNTMVGDQAGADLTSGGDNIYIGATSGSGVTTEDGTIRIGDPRFVGACYIAGIFGQTASSGVAVSIDANGKLGTLTSSARFKEDIKPMDKASEALYALEPVTFHYKKEIDPIHTSQLGLVAEDVAKVNPDLVVRDKEGKPYSVRYDQVNAMLLNEFLKEHRKVENLKNDFQATVSQQEKEIAALTATVKEQAAQIQKVTDQLEASKPAPQVVNNP
jgi:trimeric autotransporter adhesin